MSVSSTLENSSNLDNSGQIQTRLPPIIQQANQSQYSLKSQQQQLHQPLLINNNNSTMENNSISPQIQIANEKQFTFHTPQLSSFSIQESLISMLQKKCTEMAALADQEAFKRQSIEAQLAQQQKEKDQIAVLTQNIQREKNAVEIEKQKIQQTLNELQKQNQRFQEHIKQQQFTMEQQMQSIYQFQSIIQAKDNEKILLQQQIGETQAHNVTPQNLKDTPISDGKDNQEVLQQMKQVAAVAQPQMQNNKQQKNLKPTISRLKKNLSSNSQAQTNIKDQLIQNEDSTQFDDDLDQKEENKWQTSTLIEERINEDIKILRQEVKSLKTKLKKEEDSRKHWQEVCKKREDDIMELKKQNEEANVLLDKEKQNSKRLQGQLSSKIERIRFLEAQQEKQQKEKEEQTNNQQQQHLFGKSDNPAANKDMTKIPTKQTANNSKTINPGNNVIGKQKEKLIESEQHKMSSTFQSALKKDKSKSGKSVRFKEESEGQDDGNEGEQLQTVKPKLFGTGEFQF